MPASAGRRHTHSSIHPFTHSFKKGIKNLKNALILRKGVRMHPQTIHILEHGFSYCKSGMYVFLVLILAFFYCV